MLVLDEPTANLDVRAEAELFDRFIEITGGATTILISHRFSTVRRADRIVVLDDGAIVEQGSHDELVARGGPLRGALPPAGRALRRAVGDGTGTSRDALAATSSATWSASRCGSTGGGRTRSSALVLATAISVPLFALGHEGVRQRRGRRQRDPGDGARRARRRAVDRERRDRPPRAARRLRARRPERLDRLRRRADRARRRLGRPRAPREPGVREPARARALRGRRPVPRDAVPRERRRASCSSWP